jgi:hypothetical protein
VSPLLIVPPPPWESWCSNVPVEQVRHGLKPAVRVPRGALRLPRCVLDLAHLVHVDERVEQRQVHTGERPAYREPLALVALRRRDDAGDRARDGSFGNRDAGQRGLVGDGDGWHVVAPGWVQRG